MLRSVRDARGFTLIEILMVLTLLGVLAVASLELFGDSVEESRFEATTQKLKQIQNAMIGDPSVINANVRVSFGFLGDIGAIPTAAQGISALIAQPAPALPSFAINSAIRFGIGWNGPYLSGGNSGTDFTTDAWGTALVYAPAANPPTLTSLGSDRAVGGTGFAQDITVTLSNELRFANVYGFLCSRGAPFALAAQVELNYPNGSGVLTQSLVSIAIADKGQFSFTAIPFGVRSITVYQPTKAAPTTTLGPVVFTIDKPNTLVPCNAIDFNP